MFCSLMSVFMYFSGFESFAPLERWCDFAKFWCGKKKLVAVLTWKEQYSNKLLLQGIINNNEETSIVSKKVNIWAYH